MYHHVHVVVNSVLLSSVMDIVNSDSKSSDVLVREDIRQYFIYKQSPEKFLAYTKAFYKKCFDNYLSTKYA